MTKKTENRLQKLDENRFIIPKQNMMRTNGVVYANEKMRSVLLQDNALKQVENVATLPGILGNSLAMPDIHWGYGFPIGGVAATDYHDGVLSPGGVGFDINCGVRLVLTNLKVGDVKPKIKPLIDKLSAEVPSGLGSKGLNVVTMNELDDMVEEGASWMVDHGFGWGSDLKHTEENGMMKMADSSVISRKAKKRGHTRLGSLGAGNHFLEVQAVDKIFDSEKAKSYGLKEEGQVVVMIHTGSRSFGHQVCSDFLKVMEKRVGKYGINIPDKQLACVPSQSKEGQDYLKGMACAANFAWANRQTIMHRVRKGFGEIFRENPTDLGMKLVYDVAHNIAKIEEHQIDGKMKKVVVHRKGATRAFGPGHKNIPGEYQSSGQPVLVPGDMGTSSYLLAGTETAMKETFGSTCHGAGRVMSRRKAVKKYLKLNIEKKLFREKGIYVNAHSPRVAAEEAPMAYKDVSNVVDVTHNAGISVKVARMRPLGVVKG